MIKFSTNPLLFKVQYINKDVIDTTTNISAVIGKAFHQAMEVYYGGSDTLIPSDEREAIEYGLKSGLDFLEKYNDGLIKFSDKIPNKQKAFEVFSFTFNSYIKCKPYAGNGEVLAVEDEICEKIDVEWKGQRLSLPVKLKGFIDKVVRQDGRLKVKDYKTCTTFSDPDKIDGAKIIQAVTNYLLVYAKYDEAPYSMTYEEVKTTQNKDGSPQVREYEIVFEENELFFDFFFRFYEDMTRALNGQMVYVPNVHTLYDNEVGIVAYIHRLDVSEEQAKLMKKHKVETITELLKKEIQSAANMNKLMKSMEEQFVSAKSLNYEKMSNEEKIKTKLMEHGMILQFEDKIEGASVELYRYTPSIGLKMSRIRNYVDDVEQVLGTTGVRVLAPIKGTSYVGFEVPRKDRKFPKLGSYEGFNIAIGEDVMGQPRRFDIRQAPHMLVAGASGSGKSVFLNSLIEQLSAIPNAELHLYDPKMVELAAYRGRAVEYLTESVRILEALERIGMVMDERYAAMMQAGVRNISDMPGMPYKFIVIDEFGDLALAEKVQNAVLRLAQKGRAAGIHIVIATQRPSADIINGTIKANFPTKVVFRTAKAVDSRVVLDEEGAEKLLGKGDLLFSSDSGIERLQGYMA